MMRLMNLFFLIFFCSSVYGAQKKKQVDNYINLSKGFQYDHPLSKDYVGQSLRFEGTYGRYTTAKFRKAENVLRFNPRKKGTGTLIIKNKKGKILEKISVDVKETNLNKIAKEVKDLLHTIDGITIKILNNKVIIDGEILLPREMDRISAVAQEYTSTYVISFVTFSPKSQNIIAELIEREIGLHTPPDVVTVRAVYNRFILEGEVGTPEDKVRAGMIANLYTQYDPEGAGGGVKRKKVAILQNAINVRKAPKEKPEQKKIIQIVVHYVELQKSYGKGFAFQWAPSISGGGDRTAVSFNSATSKVTGALAATVSNFFPKLNWAKSFSFARVLHNASLTLEEGHQGQIQTGTQIPYSSRSQDGSISTELAKTGVSMGITPTIIGERRDTVQMQVEVNVSSLAGKAAGVPIVNSRKISTTLHVRSRLSAVLGGLINSSLSKDYNRLPPSESSGLPIVNLLSSKDYDTSKGQFVVFITPIIKTSASVGVDRIKSKFKLEEN